jgi:hypothetical protein
MGAVQIKVLRIPEISKALKIDAQGIILATQAGLLDAAEVIHQQAIGLAPFDEGFLAASGKVDHNFSGDKFEVSVSFGNEGPHGDSPTSTYALVQHERLDFWHPPKPPARQKSGAKRQGTGPVPPGKGRGPKYLEYPFTKWTDKFPNSLVAYVRKHYRAGGKA